VKKRLKEQEKAEEAAQEDAGANAKTKAVQQDGSPEEPADPKGAA
jgi:hypothetical protein